MLKKRAKKGQVEIDWAMSLGIFLLYIAWFFLFIRPSFMPPTDLHSLFSLAEDGFKQNTSWSIELMPILVKSNVSAVDEPVIADFGYNWLSGNTSFKDKRYFVMDEDKLLFLGNLSAGRNIFWIAHSKESYSLSPETKNLHANEDAASVNKNGFKADFKNGLLSSITYDNKARLSNFKVKLNNEEIGAGRITSRAFNLTSIMAKYKMESSSVNHTSYVFAENTRVYGYVASSQKTNQQKTFTIAASLTNYTNYYSTSSKSGTITALEDCTRFTEDYIDFYDTSSGLTIITDKDANISLCYDTALEIEITLSFYNSTNYKIIMHKGNYESTLSYVNYMTIKTGTIDNTTGLSSTKLNATNSTAYSALKKQWGYPEGNDINFLILNASNTAVYDYSPITPPRTANVYVKEWHDYSLDKYGVKERYKIRVKVW